MTEENVIVDVHLPGVCDLDVDVMDVMASSTVPGRQPLEEWKVRLSDTIKGMQTKDQLKDYIHSSRNKNTVRKTTQVSN